MEVRDVVGFWHVTLTPEPGCTRNNPAPALDLTVSVLSRTGAEIVTLQGGWDLAPVSNPGRPLEGVVDLRTGAFHVDLSSTSPTTGALLEGAMDSGPALTGTLTDPAADASAGILGAGSCTYVAAGQH